MAQQVIDPQNVVVPEDAAVWTPPGPIPPDLRKFGHFPDTSVWLPGDLMLFNSINPNLISRMIIKAQREAGFADDDARWHHAAVYVGDNFVCDAVPVGGVRYRTMYSDILVKRMRVRRDLTLTADERYKIAITALTRLRASYSIFEVLNFRVGASRLWEVQKLPLRTFGIVCSQLYADAYATVTSRLPIRGAHRLATPADLSATDVLADIAMAWRRIA